MSSRFSLVRSAAAEAHRAGNVFAEVRVLTPSTFADFRPDARPAAALVLLNPVNLSDAQGGQANQHTKCVYDARVGVMYFANASADGGDDDAWALADVGLAIMTNLPVPIPDTSLGAFRPDTIANVITESGEAGVYAEYLITLMWQQ